MKNKYFERIYNGLVKENPTFILMLGMCPALAVTDTAIHGVSMGLSTLAVLVLSNFLISVMRNVIPDQVRLPSYIVIVASFVTIVSLLLQAFLPSVYSALGAFIELIVVNCIILGRAEAYANKHTPGLAVMDGIGMGLGFTVALTLIGLLREFLGAGTAFDLRVFPKEYAVGIIKEAPGAFMVIALFIIIMNAIGIKTRQRQLVESNGCDGCCAKCAMRCEDKKEEEAK